MLRKLLYFEGVCEEENFLKKKKTKHNIPEFFILLASVASKILQSNCLPYCSHGILLL